MAGVVFPKHTECEWKTARALPVRNVAELQAFLISGDGLGGRVCSGASAETALRGADSSLAFLWHQGCNPFVEDERPQIGFCRSPYLETGA
jgi:hypothetical protein